jgi:hypothetical protein
MAVKEVVWRISFVRMYSAEQHHSKGRTPTPFCELRAFVFLPNKPTILELKTLDRGLEQAVNYTETIFQSIYDAKESGAVESEDALVEKDVRTVFPVTPRAKMVIEGKEVESIDEDEVMKYFRSEDKLKYFEIYRYCAFADADGTLSFEYDEDDVKNMEKLRQQRQQVP